MLVKIKNSKYLISLNKQSKLEGDTRFAIPLASFGISVGPGVDLFQPKK
jgi:hypothetical protein